MIIVRVFVPFALGFFVSYIYRSVNAVIALDLVAGFDLRPADLGLLTGAYFLAFAVAQVPLGVLLDRYGPRRPEAVLLVAAGAFLFAAAGGVSSLFVARALIGVGVSACLMASIKAFVIWYPPERRALANGCLTAFGGLGALAATAPVEAALGATDWRGVFMGLGAFTLVIAAVVYWVVPKRPGSHAPSTWRAKIAGIGEVFTSRDFWRLVPIATFSQAGVLRHPGPVGRPLAARRGRVGAHRRRRSSAGHRRRLDHRIGALGRRHRAPEPARHHTPHLHPLVHGGPSWRCRRRWRCRGSVR